MVGFVLHPPLGAGEGGRGEGVGGVGDTRRGEGDGRRGEGGRGDPGAGEGGGRAGEEVGVTQLMAQVPPPAEHDLLPVHRHWHVDSHAARRCTMPARAPEKPAL